MSQITKMNSCVIVIRRRCKTGGGIPTCESPEIECFEVRTCGEWEPPEDKVCGNCEGWEHMEYEHCDEWGLCDRCPDSSEDAADSLRHQKFTCSAWRWCGEPAKEKS